MLKETMDYKEELRLLKDKKEWEKLLSYSLKLHEKDNKDRYIVRMIVLACEKLDKEEEAVPFWGMLAKGENRPEEYSQKLVKYYKNRGDKDNWTKWSKKLLLQVLRKKDYDTLEDVWIQLLESDAIDKTFAFEIADKIVSSGEKERAFTLLDFFLLSLEEKETLYNDAIDIAKRMLEIDSTKMKLRKRLEGFYRNIYSKCSEIENFLEKANIRRSEDTKNAIYFFERIIEFCPGRYVEHRSWGVGRIHSVDLLFNKIFIDFSARPGHSINLDLAFEILSPLENDALPVLRIEKKDYLLTLKKEHPAQLIKLLLKGEETVSQEKAKALLKGIVNDDEWLDFIKNVKKDTENQGIEIKRSGSRYSFNRVNETKQKKLSLSKMKTITSPQQKLATLTAIKKEGLKPEEKEVWIDYSEKLLRDKTLTLLEKSELLFAQTEVSAKKNRLNDGLKLLLKGTKENDRIDLLNHLRQKRYKKEMFLFFCEEDYRLAEKVFLEITDDGLRKTAQRIIEKRTNIKEFLLKALLNPYKYPLCFLYSLDLVMKDKRRRDLLDKPIILFETLLEFLSKNGKQPKIKIRAKMGFSRYGFDIYRWILETSSIEEIKILLDIIKKEATIDSEDKRVFERLAETKYPTLKGKVTEEFFYVTKEALKKKQKELEHLLKVEIPANSETIGKAASQGDLSENFDYISAKEKQKKLINKINTLKRQLPRARPIEDLPFIEGIVGIGTKVILEAEGEDKKREILLLGPWDRISEKEVLSHTAPLAGELLGKKLGDFFTDNYHKKRYRIILIEKYRNQK